MLFRRLLLGAIHEGGDLFEPCQRINGRQQALLVADGQHQVRSDDVGDAAGIAWYAPLTMPM